MPRFSLMAFSSASEPLRAANRIAGHELFKWVLLSGDGQPVQASNDMISVVDCGLDEAPRVDLLMLLASYEPMASINAHLLGWLRRRALDGISLAAADTGAYVLARAGLLDGYLTTVHWEAIDDFRSRFPRIRTREALYVVDRLRLTAAGATACLDLMLHIIGCRHGPELAVSVAEQFVYSPSRSPDAAQRHSLTERLRTRNRKIQRAVEFMETRLEDPMTTREIADQLGVSLRELERIFRRRLATTPGAYYRRLRLERARTLLEQGDQSITDIACRCGFGSLASFSRSYKQAFGHSPSVARGR